MKWSPIDKLRLCAQLPWADLVAQDGKGHLTVSQFKGKRGFMASKGKGSMPQGSAQPSAQGSAQPSAQGSAQPSAQEPAPPPPPIYPPMPAQFFFEGSSDHTQFEEFIKKTILDISEAAEPAAITEITERISKWGGKLEGIAADAMEYEKKLLQAQEKLRTECEFLREAELQLKDLRQVASEKVTELEQSQAAFAQKRTQQLAKQLAEAGLSQYTAAELEKALEFMKASGESAPSQMAAEEKTTAQPQPPQPKAPPPELEPKNKAQKLAQMD